MSNNIPNNRSLPDSEQHLLILDGHEKCSFCLRESCRGLCMSDYELENDGARFHVYDIEHSFVSFPVDTPAEYLYFPYKLYNRFGWIQSYTFFYRCSGSTHPVATDAFEIRFNYSHQIDDKFDLVPKVYVWVEAYEEAVVTCVSRDVHYVRRNENV